MKMSIINCVFALLAISTVIWPVLNHFQEGGLICVCDPEILKMGNDYIVCFEGCPIKPINSKLFNVTCSHMEDITITLCKGDRYVTTKPVQSFSGDYTMHAFMNKVWKVIASLIVWLCFVLAKVPSLCIFSVLNKMINHMFPRKLKVCDKCNSTYLINHGECPTPSFKLKTDYNLIFYILLGLIVFTTFVRADDNIYNYYKHGNTTEIQVIDKEHYHQDFDVNGYLYTILIESNEYFVTGSVVYRGQLCNMPSNGCFGPNYIKDNKTYTMVSPLVIDPMTHDRELLLEHCTDPGNSDINSLEKTNFVYSNGTLIQPFDFGMLSIGIPFSGKLIGDFCQKSVVVTDINVRGCYDCQSGIEVAIQYKIPERCGQLKCLVGRVSYEYFVDVESSSMVIHSFYDREDLTIECNKYSKDVKLEHNKDTNYYKMNNAVHGSADLDFNLFKHLPNLFYNVKFMIGMVAIVLTAVYMLFNIIKQLTKHYSNYASDRVIRYKKKTDVDTYGNESLEESIFIGEAQ